MKIIERISRPQLNGLVTNTLREPSANFMLWVQLFSIMLPRMEARISGDCGILYLLKHESKEYHNRNIKDIVAYRKGTSHT